MEKARKIDGILDEVEKELFSRGMIGDTVDMLLEVVGDVLWEVEGVAVEGGRE